MKITIYELLGMIKDGKQPNHIVFDTDDWYWGYDSYIPHNFLNQTPDSQRSVSLFHRYRIDYCLNDEVEILEEEKKITKEDFIKETMNLEDITREEFNKRYEVKECNCGRGYCKGFIKVEKAQEEKKIPEKLDLILDEHFTNDELQAYIYETQEKVNQIIDYLKSKGE